MEQVLDRGAIRKLAGELEDAEPPERREPPAGLEPRAGDAQRARRLGILRAQLHERLHESRPVCAAHAPSAAGEK